MLNRADSMCVNGTTVDWSSLVIETESDGEEKGIPDENPVDEDTISLSALTVGCETSRTCLLLS